MEDSSVGQVLGATTVYGGVSMLPYAAGNPLLDILLFTIKAGMVLVVVSTIASKTYLFFQNRKNK
jgi:hypothetical protein